MIWPDVDILHHFAGTREPSGYQNRIGLRCVQGAERAISQLGAPQRFTTFKDKVSQIVQAEIALRLGAVKWILNCHDFPPMVPAKRSSTSDMTLHVDVRTSEIGTGMLPGRSIAKVRDSGTCDAEIDQEISARVNKWISAAVLAAPVFSRMLRSW